MSRAALLRLALVATPTACAAGTDELDDTDVVDTEVVDTDDVDTDDSDGTPTDTDAVDTDPVPFDPATLACPVDLAPYAQFTLPSGRPYVLDGVATGSDVALAAPLRCCTPAVVETWSSQGGWRYAVITSEEGACVVDVRTWGDGPNLGPVVRCRVPEPVTVPAWIWQDVAPDLDDLAPCAAWEGETPLDEVEQAAE